MKNQKFNAHDIRKTCEAKLKFNFRKGGKELNGWFRMNNVRVTRITMPKGRKFVPRKTYAMMAKQLELSVSEFDALLECPLNRNGYEGILKKRKST
jgi:hypothetical protein